MKNVALSVVVSHSPVGKITENLGQMKQWIAKARQNHAAMVCFPELNLTGYAVSPDMVTHALSLEDNRVLEIAQQAVKNHITVMFGMVEKAADEKCYASHVVFGPHGHMGVYRKLHIAPPEKDLFVPGEDMPVFEGPGCQYGIQLCYDAHFPELSAQMALKGAEVVFIPHASPRGTPAEKYDSWMRHLTARAYDNSMYVVAWNQVGKNGKGLDFPGLLLIVGPDGKVFEKKECATEEMVLVTLDGDLLKQVRENRMHFFLPHRRGDLY